MQATRGIYDVDYYFIFYELNMPIIYLITFANYWRIKYICFVQMARLSTIQMVAF